MYSSPDLIKEILDKKRYITKKGKSVYNVIEDLFNGNLEREALQHSLRLELPLVKTLDMRVSKKDKEYYKKEIERLSNSLKDAWEFGKKNFKIPFKKEFICQLAHKIDPLSYDGNGYRKVGVRPTGSSVTPPYPDKINLSMDRFFEQLEVLYKECQKRKKTDSSIPERFFDIGSWIHLNLVKIHPFEDTNGRTSRMLHNLYLRSSNSFPPIIIYEGERNDYYDHIEKAIIGIRNRDGERNLVLTRNKLSDGEKEFYDYMAGKLNVTLDMLIEKE